MSDQFLGEGILRVDITPQGGALFTYAGDTAGANAFDVNGNISTLDFPGNHNTLRRYRENGITGVIGSAALDIALFDACGVAAVSGGLPSGRANRYYPQLGTYPPCMFEVYYFETDVDEVDTETVLTVFLAKIQQWTPGNAGNLAVQPVSLPWSAKRTLVDINGDGLPGVSTKPVSYAFDTVA